MSDCDTRTAEEKHNASALGAAFFYWVVFAAIAALTLFMLGIKSQHPETHWSEPVVAALIVGGVSYLAGGFISWLATASYKPAPEQAKKGGAS